MQIFNAGQSRGTDLLSWADANHRAAPLLSFESSTRSDTSESPPCMADIYAALEEARLDGSPQLGSPSSSTMAGGIQVHAFATVRVATVFAE